MKCKAKHFVVPVALLLTSCASSPVALTPVGPNPYSKGGPGSSSKAPQVSAHTGYLRVYSARELVTEGYDGGNPSYHQHSPYSIYDAKGRLVKYVGNTAGEYATAPKVVRLPPGSYVVKARAKDYLIVNVPVVVESGRTTSVHLDDRWSPPAGTLHTELVIEPSGTPVGWRSVSTEQPGKPPQAG